MTFPKRLNLAVSAAIALMAASCQKPPQPSLSEVHPAAYSASSINVIADQHNAVYSYKDTQYATFYDKDARLIVAKKGRDSATWQTVDTGYSTNAADAHNTASLILDGSGFIHLAWGHHNQPLNYIRSTQPETLEFGDKLAMTGSFENKVSYPHFFSLSHGDLLFLYRDGESGKGNTVLKRYSLVTKKWNIVSENLIDGEGERSAYFNATIDPSDTLHLAWNWRESPDVASNHDLCYARSRDGGKTWTDAFDAPQSIPFTQANAPYALKIPQNSNLMNPPAIAADEKGTPAIANYWNANGSDITQYHLVYFQDGHWQQSQVTKRTTAFDLSGTNTKRPPLSRAILLSRDPAEFHLIYRDDEKGGRPILSSSQNLAQNQWSHQELLPNNLDAWEPSYDLAAWKESGVINIPIQTVIQIDGKDHGQNASAGSAYSLLSVSP